MVNSEAHKELAKKRTDWTTRPEWSFKVFKKPAGLVIDHFGDVITFSKRELEELVTGRVDMARYPMIPKRLYRTLLVRATEALGIIYRPYMLEQIIPPKVKKVRIEFPEPFVWDVALKRAEDLKRRIDYVEKEYISKFEALLKLREKK